MDLVIKHIELGRKRAIVMSDLHGHFGLFKCALEKAKLTIDDVVIIVGDICEKGEDNLLLVQYLMELSKTHELHAVMGNCDTIAQDIFSDSKENHIEIRNYMQRRSLSIFHDMRKKLGLEMTDGFDIAAFKALCREHFSKELDFLMKLPHIIESEHYIFVHAGLTSEVLEENKYEDCLTLSHFMQRDVSFQKYVIVGHYPVSIYNEYIANCTIRVDEKKHMIGIDGGCGVKHDGQINILELQGTEWRMHYVDEFPKIRLLEAQAEKRAATTLSFPKTEIEIVAAGAVSSLCYLEHINRTMQIPNENIYNWHNVNYCSDFTDYEIKAQAGDIVSFCKKGEDCIEVKKDGIIGIYRGKYESV